MNSRPLANRSVTVSAATAGLATARRNSPAQANDLHNRSDAKLRDMRQKTFKASSYDARVSKGKRYARRSHQAMPRQ
jgi:hypothetical protein